MVTRRILELLAANGWDVEWFSSRYQGAAGDEVVSGIRYRRQGSELTCRIASWKTYCHEAREGTLFVDQINTLPFYAHIVFRKPTIALINQLAREIWLYETAFPVSLVGYVMEPIYLKPYRDVPVVTISPSTSESLRHLGFRGEIAIIPMASDGLAHGAILPKIGQDIAVVARLVPSKRVDHAIRAALELRKLGWSGTLHIVGDGEHKYVSRLKDAARGLQSQVVFHGRAPEEQKATILAKSSLLWMTSVREGWGLVIIEAAKLGAPAIVYDVPGLRDAVVDNVTGRVITPSPLQLAIASLELLNGPSLGRLAASAVEHSRALSWERSAAAFEKAIVDFSRARS